MGNRDGFSTGGDPPENPPGHHAAKPEHADGDRVHPMEVEQQPAVEPFLGQRLLYPGQ
jgi:hypothetical protein